MNPVRNEGGQFMVALNNFKNQGQARNMFYGESQATSTKYSSVPVGYTAPFALYLSPKAGGLGVTYSGIAGSASVNAANLAAGYNLGTDIQCTGVLVASQLQTVISMAANLSASGTITNAQLVSFVNMVAALAASGTMTATIGALSNLVASITASASMTPEMNATANMEADITPFTTLSPESLASAVWNAEAAAYNASGTMGQKMNGAGSAGDPWTTDLDSYTTPGTAGALMKKASKPKISL